MDNAPFSRDQGRDEAFRKIFKPEIDARDRLIVALDLPDIPSSQAMIQTLDGVSNFFKVGLALQLAPGVESLIDSLLETGKKLFLDYKYYDIPETLTKAVSRAAARGVTFLTIHGSSSLIAAAVKGRGQSAMKLFTVTVLTSLDESDLSDLGYSQHTVSAPSRPHGPQRRLRWRQASARSLTSSWSPRPASAPSATRRTIKNAA